MHRLVEPAAFKCSSNRLGWRLIGPPASGNAQGVGGSLCPRPHSAQLASETWTVAAQRGRTTSQPPDGPSGAEGSAGRTNPGAAEHQQEQKLTASPRPRPQFGPEPPPPPPPPKPAAGSTGLPLDAGATPGSTQSAQQQPVPTAPKRRGRPPKEKPGASPTSSGDQQQQPESPSSASTSAPAPAARRPFGPELPPQASSTGPSTLPDPFSLLDLPPLPEDPSRLNVDDILGLPLPDPRVGEPFRLGGPMDDSVEGVEGEDGDDDFDDLDYDELIALASRVDVPRYIERAFERAKQGLEPTPDPELIDAEAEAVATAPTAAAEVAQGAQAARATESVPAPAPASAPVKAQAAGGGERGMGDRGTGVASRAGGAGAAGADGAAAAASSAAAPSVGGDDDISWSPEAANPAPPAPLDISIDLEAEDEFSPPSPAPAPPTPPPPPPPSPPAPTATAAPPHAQGASSSAAGPAPDAAAATSGSPSPSSGAAEPGGSGLSPQDEAAARRRVEILVQLLSASGAELEARLEAVAPEIDEQMLALLEARYATALRLKQDAATADRIASLFRALRYIFQRRSSSPAERLLDDVLDVLGDVAAQPDPQRRRNDAAARLRSAFTGGMLEVDVFTAAAALAEKRQAAAEVLAGESVSVEAFKAEAMGLLEHAQRVQNETAEAVAEIEAEAARVREADPAALQGREWRARLSQVDLARKALADREASIEALGEVVLLTRAIEVQMLTGRVAA